MNWIAVAVAAVCVVVAGGVATLLVRDRLHRKPLYAAVWVVSAAVLVGLSQWWITPNLQARYDASVLDASLAGNAAFAAIRKHDPETYERMMSELRAGLLQGQTRAQLVEVARQQIGALVQKRLPRASDEAATEYMRVMVQEMTELRQRGGDLCYRFLFGGPQQSLDMRQYVSVNTIEADSSALSQVLRSASVSPQPVPAQADVAERMKPVITALAGRYGPDLALLQQPQAPGVDRDKLCSISIDMYSVILQMPPADSGKLIRYLMGQG